MIIITCTTAVGIRGSIPSSRITICKNRALFKCITVSLIMTLIGKTREIYNLSRTYYVTLNWMPTMSATDLSLITYLCTFTDNGVYVALQPTSVNVVSDKWRWAIILYSYRQSQWDHLHARGRLSHPVYMGRTALHGLWATRHTPMVSHYLQPSTLYHSPSGVLCHV